MKANELQKLPVDDLLAKSRELRAELFNFRVKHATGQLENTARLGTLRRDVARVETVLAQKQEASQ